jgi:hypothetical protein
MSAASCKTRVDTGPPGSRASGSHHGTGRRCAKNQRQLRGENNRPPPVVQRCRTTLCRTGNVTFAGQLNLEDGERCRVRVAFHGQQLQMSLCSLTRLSWTQANLEPAADLDFSGHLAWGHRRYFVGIRILSKPHLCLGMFLRPLHLHRATSQLGVVK